jgi:hypothetical protein
VTRYVYQWPSALRITGSGWVTRHRIGATRSLLTGALYQTESHRPRIMATVSGVSAPAHMPDLNIFLARMRGGHNLVELTDWEAFRNGSAGNAYRAADVLWSDDGGAARSWDDGGTLRPWSGALPILAADAAAGAASVSVAGLWPGITAFPRGAEIAVNGWPYRVTADVVADADGLATVPIAPRLVSAAGADDAVTYEHAGLFVLSAPPAGLDQRDINGIARWTMQFMQVFTDELGEVPVHESA